MVIVYSNNMKFAFDLLNTLHLNVKSVAVIHDVQVEGGQKWSQHPLPIEYPHRRIFISGAYS